MLRIEVKDKEVSTFQGESSNGRPFTIHNQAAYVHLKHKAYPVEIKLNLEAPSEVYEPGFYTVSEESFFVNKFSSLDLAKRLVLLKEGSKI